MLTSNALLVVGVKVKAWFEPEFSLLARLNSKNPKKLPLVPFPVIGSVLCSLICDMYLNRDNQIITDRTTPTDHKLHICIILRNVSIYAGAFMRPFESLEDNKITVFIPVRQTHFR